MAHTTASAISCNDIMELPLATLLNALLVKIDADGTVGFRTQVVSAAANAVTPLMDCSNNASQDPEIAFRRAIGIDTEGKLALNLIKVN